MIQKDRLAIIPARSGSKGIPDKNIRLLNGRPMIDYAIKSALDSDCFDRVIVSTDCQEIANVAISCGAEVPFLRPAELASDTAKSIDAILHVLDSLPTNYTSACLLQVTAPLRTSADIQSALKVFEVKEVDSLVSVCPLDEPHPHKLKVIENGKLKPYISGKQSEVPRQLLPPCYFLNGAIYLNKVSFLKEYKTFFAEQTLPFIMPPERSVNIDTPIDLVIAEALLKGEVKY